MEREEVFFDRIIIPDRAIYDGMLYRMNIDRKFILKGYKVKSINKKIDQIFVKGTHPNANPRTREFCIPNKLRKYSLNSETTNVIQTIMRCFNLDDCYFTPWDEIEINPMEVLCKWENKKLEKTSSKP
ncbi:MAG: hypothetical protein ACTSWJ_10955 [Candidatus Heimdallarchaeaceae archaeon]